MASNMSMGCENDEVGSMGAVPTDAKYYKMGSNMPSNSAADSTPGNKSLAKAKVNPVTDYLPGK